jgi:hypothetical protein
MGLPGLPRPSQTSLHDPCLQNISRSIISTLSFCSRQSHQAQNNPASDKETSQTLSKERVTRAPYLPSVLLTSLFLVFQSPWFLALLVCATVLWLAISCAPTSVSPSRHLLRMSRCSPPSHSRRNTFHPRVPRLKKIDLEDKCTFNSFNP